MWEHRCSHTNKDGSQCKRKSTLAVWAFKHEGECFDFPVWGEYCGNHVTDAEHIVSTVEV